MRPDGVVTGRLRRHAPGVLISEVDTDAGIDDSTVAWRERAMDGVLHSGTLVRDEGRRHGRGCKGVAGRGGAWLKGAEVGEQHLPQHLRLASVLTAGPGQLR